MPIIPNVFPLPQPEQAASSTNQDLSFYPASNNLELIELLVTGETGTSGENFFQKFQSILKKTPKIGTTAKPEFWTYGVMGTFTVLPNTQLMKNLNIKHIYLNPVHSKEGYLTVKVALQLEQADKKSLRFFTFASTKQIAYSQHWQADELREVIAHLRITQHELENYKINNQLQISGYIYQIDPKFNLHLEDMKVGSGRDLKNYKELSSEFEGLIEQAPLPKPEENKGIFKQIIQLTKETLNSETGKPETVGITDLESHFKRLASYSPELDETTDVIQREALLKRVAQAVESAGSNIFKDLSTLYNHWKPILGLGEAEVCAHGYSYVVVENLFKYRYALDISVEKNLGTGRSDLTFLSRLDGAYNKRLTAVPVNVEFKAGSESPGEALAQVGEQGYLHHSPRIRTVSSQGVALGVNFGFSKPVSSAIKLIKVHPTNFIRDLLEVSDAVIRLDISDSEFTKRINELTDKLQLSLTDIYYAMGSGNGGIEPFLLGQAMGCIEANLPTKIFMGEAGSYTEKDITFLFQRGKNIYVLNLIRNSGLFPIVDEPKSELNQVPSLELIKEQFKGGEISKESEYVRINVMFKPGESNQIKEVRLKKGSFQFHSDQAGGKTKYFSRYHKGAFETIKPVQFIDAQGDVAFREISAELFDKKVLINAEKDVKAFIQGGLLASEKYQVFPESNHLLGGIADLVVVPINRAAKELIKVFELKHGQTHLEAQELHTAAQEQVQGYVENLKSFTDGREVELVALTYDAESGQGEDLFLYKKLPTQKIVHTSGSEHGKNSPEHRDVDSPPHEQDVEMPSVDEAVNFAVRKP